MKRLALLSLFLPSPLIAQDNLPAAIQCYQASANAQDLDAYMECFAPDAEMIDVSRTFIGQDAIRAWAEREVMPGGNGFQHREILEQSEGYAKTEASWSSWTVLYSYWWNSEGKITKMSLQYGE